MSQWRGRFDADSDRGIAVELLSKWYHVPTIVALIVFMFWTRARTWGAFVSDGTVVFSGNDPWYHLRQVTYVTENWPSTMPFDAFTNYPTGTSVSQFGTIYDQVVGTVALIVGLGDPSQETIRMVLLFAPAAVGALTAVPTYYLGKRLSGKIGGVVAVLLLALSTGEFLRRSLVGFADHHVAEALMQALAVLAIVVALQVADREKPVWELFVDRDTEALRRPVAYAVLAGVATALYIWTWPPGTLLVGVLGIYVTAQLSLSYLRGDSPEPVAITGAILFAVVAVLTLIPLDTVGYEAVSFSLLQPTLSLAGAGWCVLLGAIARVWDDRSYPAWTYPLTALGIVGAGVVVLALIAPSIFNLIVNNAQRVLVPGSTGQAAGTVAEVQPLSNPQSAFFSWYGLAGVAAAVGAIVALGQAVVSERPRSELLLVPLWLLTMVLAALTQQRFSYYTAVPVVVTTAYVVGLGVTYLRSVADDSDDGIETYQVLAILTVIMILVVPMFAGTALGQNDPSNVFNQSDDNHNGVVGYTGWQSSLDWMSDETPTEGTFAGADNEMDPYATHAKTDDFDYEAGSYGVLSWWDYGHWITAGADRIPVANPFQQSARDAARFLLAQNESQANQIIGEMSDGENRDTRYVMVDWQMATGASKFTAPTAFVDSVDREDFIRPIYVGQQGRFLTYKQAYYDTMVNRLYRYHGSAQEPFARSATGRAVPVVNWDTVQAETRDGEQVTLNTIPRNLNRSVVETYSSMQEAQQAINGTDTAQIGGIGRFPSERVPALEHYRLVHVSDVSVNPLVASHRGLIRLLSAGVQVPGLDNSALGLAAEQNPQYTKTFERVEGATVEGTGPANATVQAGVRMEMPNANSTFLYTQRARTDADGSFNMTLPYSTTGYDAYGPENGYTNTSVRATGSYEFQVQRISFVNESLQRTLYNASADVPEEAVVEGGSLDVTLTEADLPQQGQSGEGNESTGSLAGPDAALPRADATG